MKKTLLFVHGTGVRGPAYELSCKLVKKQLEKFELDFKLAPCLWGDAVGARLPESAKSIPTYDTTRAGAAQGDDGQQALWALLLQDPAFELRMLAELPAPPRTRAPNQRDPVIALLENFATLRFSVPLSTELARLGMTAGIDDDGTARTQTQLIDALISSPGYDASKASALAGTPKHRAALARAVVASLQKAALESGTPMLDRAGRDALAGFVQGQLGDDTRGVGAFLAAPFKGLMLNLTTSHLRRKRGALSDSASPAAGDILLYQARGARIRAFIRARLDELKDDEVTILAHSLGGIACMELLVESTPPNVKRLVTFGSQAPFLHELGALSTLEPGAGLPGHFPPWSNFYDLSDPLSYIGAGVFPGKVSDYKVESGESFPASHSAYLHSTPFWQQLRAVMRDV